MSNNLDHLIPQSVLDCLDLHRIKIKLVLRGESARGQWPCVRLILNNQVIYDGIVKTLTEIDHDSSLDKDQRTCNLNIVYYNKTDNDTVVDANGNITENQCVHIEKFEINEVDIIKTKLIHADIGAYTMTLSPEKYNFFSSNGLSVGPTTNTHMYENGVWAIELPVPILSFFVSKNNHQERWEQIDIPELTNRIYQQFLICKTITN